jgi:hypothetical protein
MVSLKLSPAMRQNIKDIFYCLCAIFLFGEAPPSRPLPSHARGFEITHNDTPQSVGLHWMRNQLVAETSTWQHKTHTTDRHPWTRWDSNPQSQQASSRRPTPYTARSLGSMTYVLYTWVFSMQVCLLRLYERKLRLPFVFGSYETSPRKDKSVPLLATNILKIWGLRRDGLLVIYRVTPVIIKTFLQPKLLYSPRIQSSSTISGGKKKKTSRRSKIFYLLRFISMHASLYF